MLEIQLKAKRSEDPESEAIWDKVEIRHGQVMPLVK
jgi:hypothetical protein